MTGPYLKKLVWLNGAVPLVLLAWDAAHGQLGSNPVNFAIRTTGILSLIFLTLTMAVTPIVAWTGWSALAGTRRVVGLYAFYHAFIHFVLFVVYDRAGDLADAAKEIGSRVYLMVGIVGLVLMLPLAVTSTNGFIRRLGPSRWKLLHRLAYIAAGAGALHFFLLVKSDLSKPIIYSSLIGAFLLWRAVHHYLDLRRAAQQPAVSPRMRTRFGTAPLRIAIVIPESPDVKTFRFVPVDGASLPFIHQAGQYLTLTLEIDGKRIRRSYTISSPPTRPGSLDITVKRELKGLASTFLHNRIQAGDELTVSGPGGKLTFDPRSASRLVLIGGGIGITPLMSQIRHLTDLGWTGEIQLIHSVRTPADAVFRAELAELARRHPNLTVAVTATRDAGPDWTGERGRIDAEMIRRHVPDLSDARVHLCGPTEMAGPLTDTLVALGIPIDRIHQETFTSATRRDGEPATAVAPVDIDPAATLSFARSGRTVGELRGRTVLEVAEANGVAISYDCRSGICGQCKTRLIAGDVTMDADDALTASDRTAGRILACQARCRTDVTVDA